MAVESKINPSESQSLRVVLVNITVIPHFPMFTIYPHPPPLPRAYASNL